MNRGGVVGGWVERVVYIDAAGGGCVIVLASSGSIAVFRKIVGADG